MSKFSDRLIEQIHMEDSAELLNDYLTKRSGRNFELFQRKDNKPNEVTPSDLLAVSQLSMKIGGYQERDSIPESAVIKLFDKDPQKRLSRSLAKIKTNWRLETIQFKDLESFNNEIEKLLEDNLILKTPGVLSKEEIVSLIKHNMICNETKYTLLYILNFNIRL